MLDVMKESLKNTQNIIHWRRELHKIPELGLELPKTVAFVTGELGRMGIPYHTLVNGSAIVALITGTGEGSTIALRADMDALAIEEETGLEFASNSGCMHACGHDGHTAILLGVAKILSENTDCFKGQVKLLFQPGEELPGGAKPMIDEGALKDPDVDRIIGLHIGNISEELRDGDFGFSYGGMMASMDRFLIRIKGKGSHGAYPEKSIDPIVVAAEVITAMQPIISREKTPSAPAVLSICRVTGGKSHNVIPDVVELEGTVRTVNQALRERIASRMDAVLKGITMAHEADYEFEYFFEYPPVINNEEFTRFVMESAKRIFPEDCIQEIKIPSMGGEDFAYFLEAVPGTFIFMRNPREIGGKSYPHHNSRFDIDDSVLYKGCALFIQATLDYLNND